jgi:hypothetical protein
MWAEFEWENKVAVNTTFTDCNEFLQHIVATTNMRCLTLPAALDGEGAGRWFGGQREGRRAAGAAGMSVVHDLVPARP